MADIFISYAREDLERVIPIVEELKKRDWSVFIDVESIQGGANWPRAIDEALDNSHCVVVFWSSNSVDIQKHPLVWGEAVKGRNRGILVPVRIDIVDSPTGFGHLQSIDLIGWSRSHPSFHRVVEAITVKISTSKPPASPRAVPVSSPETNATPVPVESESAAHQQPAIPELKIGDKYGGGKVAWLDSTGKHGLIAAEADLPERLSWNDAKKACSELKENGFSDWYLPSKEELNKLHHAKDTLGGFVDINYWSSTEFSANYAWFQDFGSGSQYINDKDYVWRVRPVRSF